MTPEIAWRPAWPTSWPQVNRAVERLRDGVAEALGGELIGVYLGGSLALGGFDRSSSDVDVLVATARMPSQPAIERLAALHAALRAAGGWTARLEAVYLPVAALRRHDPADTRRYPIASGAAAGGGAGQPAGLLGRPARRAWAGRRFDPPWPELVARALTWRADPHPDDRGLADTLRLVADAAARARSLSAAE